MTPLLSIVIVNYNTRDYLRRCLDSIQAHAGDLAPEIVVVDNGSTDGSVEMLRQGAPDVTVIEPGRNTWFSGGNNLGFAAAAGEYVLILNADTLVQPGTLQTMLDYLRAHPEVGAVTCPQNSPEGKRLYTCSRAPGYLDLLLGYTFVGVLLAPWRARRRARMWYAGWARDSTRAVEVAPGSCILARLSLIRQLDGFDEAFKLYFTEDELCRRILAAGYGVHFVAGTLLVHEEQASTRQVRRLASRIYFDDLLVYARKFYGRPAALLLRALVTPTRLAMDVVQRLRNPPCYNRV